jgi:hypothetical protein
MWVESLLYILAIIGLTAIADRAIRRFERRR